MCGGMEQPTPSRIDFFIDSHQQIRITQLDKKLGLKIVSVVVKYNFWEQTAEGRGVDNKGLYFKMTTQYKDRDCIICHNNTEGDPLEFTCVSQLENSSILN